MPEQDHLGSAAGEARDERRFDELVDESGEIHCLRVAPNGALAELAPTPADEQTRMAR